jgi:hypothetical protein
MKIVSVGAELFHADRQKDRRNEANSRFSQFCEDTKNKQRRKCMCNLTSERVRVTIIAVEKQSFLHILSV